MSLVIGLRKADKRLARLNIADAITEALRVATADLEARVADVLSELPGREHSIPWLRSGALRASIGHEVDGAVGVVGSTSDVAVDQELGTSTVPPRSFLASTAAGAAADIAASVAGAIAQVLEQMK